MLIKRAVLDRIASREIDLIFRRWRRPTVKSSGQLHTAVGMLDIVEVERFARSAISDTDAGRAGCELSSRDRALLDATASEVD